MAYFHDDGGALAPVRDTQNTDRDKDWINLRFTDYDGPRIRLGVLKVINKSPESEDQGGGRIVVPVSGIVEMLTVSLYDTKRFDVIEEKRIQEVEREQKRKDVQEPSPNSIMNVGKVLGAQYLVYGTVNEWDPNRGGRHMGSGSALNGVTSKLFHGGINRMLGGSSGSIGGTKQEAEVAVTFSLTDVANGQILFTTSERARLGEWSVNWGAPGGESTGKVEKTPVNYAFRACANKAAFKIATFLRTRKWKGSVVQIKGADIFVNAGSQQGMAPDSLLAVQAVRGLITDPENHTILGEDLHGIGTLKVIAVQPGFSIARKKEGCKGLKKGDRVELATDPVPPQRIPACDALDTSASV
ncbi:MAG TPA: CsgG/HfaB family protein [Thermoanaerobaculia bacterium]|jgi:curli biogenesis system outer membrane secretion channel CsgG